MKIYCAGKIHHKDWRTALYSRGLDLTADPDDMGICPTGFDEYQNILPIQWPIVPIGNENHYTGPYFLTCDHGCFHGDNAHGVGADELVQHRSAVVKLCKAAIATSDAMFVWLNDSTAYGTITEIGYAAALGKRIWIYGTKRFDDMWFVYQMAAHANIDKKYTEDMLPGIVKRLK